MRIDAHAHVWIADGRRQATSLDRLLDACDRLEIDEAWVSCPVTHGMGSPEEVRERLLLRSRRLLPRSLGRD
jgi:hypothetical protein